MPKRPEETAVGPPPQPAPAAPVNLEQFRAEMRTAGVEHAVDATLAAYMREIPGQMERLIRAIADRNAAEMAAVSHAMKSASGSIRAEALAGLLEQAEMLSMKADTDGVDQLIGQIRAEYDAVLACLQGTVTP